MHNYLEIIAYWQQQNIDSIPKLEQALDNFNILFAYNSGVIENPSITYHDTREIFENGKVNNYTGNLRTLYEIANQKDCASYLLPKIIKKEPLTEELLKKIHKLLTKGTYDETRYNINGERPGEYKKHDYVTGRNEVGADVLSVAIEIKDLLEEVASIKTNDAETIIKIAAYTHNVLESIHAFADGNGRLGRTIANYILLTNNLPPIIIYDEDKKYYYACLEKFDEEEDLSAMIEFFKYEMENTWRKTLDLKEGKSKKTFKISDCN